MPEFSEGFGTMVLSEMEERIENLDLRVSRVEQILPTLATKTDLADLRRDLEARIDRCATKADLTRFATKADLTRFATKADLKRFATKEDLKRFATKQDLKRLATKADLKRFATKRDLEVTKKQLRAAIADGRRHTIVLFESLRDDIRIVAEGLARLIERLEQKGVI